MLCCDYFNIPFVNKVARICSSLDSGLILAGDPARPFPVPPLSSKVHVWMRATLRGWVEQASFRKDKSHTFVISLW